MTALREHTAISSMGPDPSNGRCGQSGRQPLAAARPAIRDHLAATLGCHAGTEPVTAFADKFGWLVGTFRHLFVYRGVRPFLDCRNQVKDGVAGMH